jgi:hypothetical protein
MKLPKTPPGKAKLKTTDRRRATLIDRWRNIISCSIRRAVILTCPTLWNKQVTFNCLQAYKLYSIFYNVFSKAK